MGISEKMLSKFGIVLLGSVYGQITNDTLPVDDDDEVDSIAMAESVITIIAATVFTVTCVAMFIILHKMMRVMEQTYELASEADEPPRYTPEQKKNQQTEEEGKKKKKKDAKRTPKET